MKYLDAVLSPLNPDKEKWIIIQRYSGMVGLPITHPEMCNWKLSFS